LRSEAKWKEENVLGGKNKTKQNKTKHETLGSLKQCLEKFLGKKVCVQIESSTLELILKYLKAEKIQENSYIFH